MLIYIGITILVMLIFWKVSYLNNYWKRKGVIQRDPFPILGENADLIFKLNSFAQIIQRAYNFGENLRYVGVYQMMQPILVIRDPELIKQIAVKDFDVFMDHYPIIKNEVDPLWMKNLLALRGSKWKNMRVTLSPSFTSSKMKMMFKLISEVSEQFVEHFCKNPEGQTVEMKDIFTRYANDVIASTAFGINCDSVANKNNEFYLLGKEISNFSGFFCLFRFLFISIFPKLATILGIKLFMKKVHKFFTELITNNIKMRKDQGIIRQDMIHLLLEARKGLLKEDDDVKIDTGFATVEESNLGISQFTKKLEITDEDIISQALIFFFAGFDSVSALMCFMAYELALNIDIQRKLRNEILDTYKECNGKLTYESLMKMKYMDMVVSETLRKWPIIAAPDRISIKPYTIQPVNPKEKPVELPVDSVIWIPIFGIHRDPQYYPEPDRFNPERFSNENKDNIKPYTYLPFGVGPRNYIGSRFALLETKTIMFYLLLRMNINVVDKTVIPIKLSIQHFVLNANDGFYLELKRI